MQIRNRPVAAACIFLLLILTAPALAWHPAFKKADTNKDGKISRDELRDYMKENAFERLDNDKSRGISPDEWSHTHDVIEIKDYGKAFRSVDRDRDSRITFPEFSNYLEKYSNIEDAFMIMDRNKDGVLGPDEISYFPKFRLISIHF